MVMNHEFMIILMYEFEISYYHLSVDSYNIYIFMVDCSVIVPSCDNTTNFDANVITGNGKHGYDYNNIIYNIIIIDFYTVSTILRSWQLYHRTAC